MSPRVRRVQRVSRPLALEPASSTRFRPHRGVRRERVAGCFPAVGSIARTLAISPDHLDGHSDVATSTIRNEPFEWVDNRSSASAVDDNRDHFGSAFLEHCRQQLARVEFVVDDQYSKPGSFNSSAAGRDHQTAHRFNYWVPSRGRYRERHMRNSRSPTPRAFALTDPPCISTRWRTIASPIPTRRAVW